MTAKPTQRLVAEALGLSPGRVSQLRRDGMPVGDIEAARSWYARRVDQARSHGQKQAALLRRPSASLPDPPAVAPLDRVAVLATRAERLLEAGRFGEVDAALRQALAAVDPADWHLVELHPDAWMHLTAEVRAAASEFEAEGDERAEGENSDMSAFWYAVAAGLVRATANNDTTR